MGHELERASLIISLPPALYARYHRLKMELDLQSLFGLLCTAVLIG